MSLPIPLTVVLKSPAGARSITREVADLRIRWQIPGGYGPCTIDLARPIAVQPQELAYYSDLTVYDARNGQTVYQGRVEDLGRSAGRDGQVWQVAALGPSSHAKDLTRALVYADQQLESSSWRQADLTSGQSKGSVVSGDGTSNAPTLRVQWDSGQSIPQNRVLTARYVRMADGAQWIARVGANHVEGAASTVLKVQVVSRRLNGFTGTGVDAALESDDWTTSTATLLQRYGVEHSDKFNGLDVRLQQTNPTAVTSNENYWTSLTGVYVIGSRYLRDGTEKTSGYTTTTVLASEVVEDLLGRLLPLFDGPSASIETTSYGIDQLAYPDGANPDKILNDLMALHPTMYWAAWEKTVSGRHRFEWTSWPSTVRYEAGIGDGFDAPMSAAEVWDGVLVRGRDTLGAVRTSRRTSTVPLLAAAGIHRETSMDLGDEVWSTANISQAGIQFLAEHQYPPNAGTLTIARPILDVQTGRTVQPWEIRPGLIRVRGVSPAGPDLYNPAGGRNGFTIFRVVAADYQASDNTARLELDSRPRTARQMLADAANMPKTRRR